MGKSPTIVGILPWFAGAVLSFLLVMLGAGILRPNFNLKPVAGLAMISALLIMGGFEWTREAARRPYVINEVMYSNGILKKDVEDLNQKGYLRTALWVENREVSEGNLVAAGQELFMHQCYACHTVNGKNNDIVKATGSMSYNALVSYIRRIHDVRYFMPPFVGTDLESRALTVYIAGGLQGKDVQEHREETGTSKNGAALFEENCSSCHAVEDLTSVLDGVEIEEIVGMLKTLDEISDEMQPLAGSEEDHVQLASFLSGQSVTKEQEAPMNGADVFDTHCTMCHGITDMKEKTENMDRQELFTLLGRLDQLQVGMPPFKGTEPEREALADFLESINKGGE
jgi:mono/diheme cytochrome c family protein